ncbi:MAG TPA: hypothetical protein VGI39_01085, partial [Polyangiaceae bacterium]
MVSPEAGIDVVVIVAADEACAWLCGLEGMVVVSEVWSRVSVGDAERLDFFCERFVLADLDANMTWVLSNGRGPDGPARVGRFGARGRSAADRNGAPYRAPRGATGGAVVVSISIRKAGRLEIGDRGGSLFLSFFLGQAGTAASRSATTCFPLETLSHRRGTSLSTPGDVASSSGDVASSSGDVACSDGDVA